MNHSLSSNDFKKLENKRTRVNFQYETTSSYFNKIKTKKINDLNHKLGIGEFPLINKEQTLEKINDIKFDTFSINKYIGILYFEIFNKLQKNGIDIQNIQHKLSLQKTLKKDDIEYQL